MEITHTTQPDAYSCGATCIKMLADAFQVKASIDEIKSVCRSNPNTGTVGGGMESGLRYLNLDFERLPITDPETAMERLEIETELGHPVILRTLIRGMKHWIIRHNRMIIDPAFGTYTMSPDAIHQIWEPRKFDGFVVGGVKPVIGEPVIDHIYEKDIDEILHLSGSIFSNVLSYDSTASYVMSAGPSWENSAKLVVGGQIVGFYLIVPGNNLPTVGGRGVEGLALGIAPGFRGNGFGELLKDWMEQWATINGYNYVWGNHVKSLGNRTEWLKRRELFDEGVGMFTTIKYLA